MTETTPAAPLDADEAFVSLMRTLMSAGKQPATRYEWDHLFLAVAATFTLRSTCTRRQVGALMVDDHHFVIAAGYNGTSSGFPHCGDGGCPRGALTHTELAANTDYSTPGTPGWCPALHAEDNACTRAGDRARGATIYITHPPCPNCVKRLAGAGVSRAVSGARMSGYMN